MTTLRLRSSLGALLLLGGGLGAHAQHQPDGPAYNLGRAQALAQQLESQAGTAQRGGAAPTVTLRVSADQAFAGRVNYRQDLAAGEYVVGELQGVPGSSFQLRVDGQQVEGHILLKNSKQAYRYEADKAGNATVRAVDIDKVVCVDYNRPVGYQEPAPAAGNAANRAAVVSLQSLPGARGCIMLDVDGYALPAGTGWNKGNAFNAPSANMTDANVQALWELVSEDFRPFSLNVTTDEAVFNTYPKNMRMRCVISPGSGSTIAPGAGGVAFLTSFRTNDDTPCWVFMSDPKAGGEASSHEVGHTLGLSHDGRTSPKEEYTTNDGNRNTLWAPIMGAGYYKPVTQWSRGEYNSASQTQDDLAIMSGSTYNVGYRNDDHANATAGATALSRNGNAVAGGGIIERTADQDYFSFTTGGGAVSLSVNTVSRYGNLDIVARLFDDGGTLIGTFDTPAALPNSPNLNATVSATLGAGTYYLQVDGTSSGNPATDGYSDYGSLGTYTIAGTVPAGGGGPAGVATLFRDCPFSGASASLPVGDYTLAALQARGILNDDISSLRVSSGYEVALFDLDNFQGSSITVVGDADCLVGRSFNDLTTSVRVRTVGTATLYQDCNFGGYARALPAVGDYTLGQLQALGVLNDDLSSLRVNSGFEVVLYENDNFGGASLTVRGDNACLVNNALGSGRSWNDQVSSLRVRAATAAGGAAVARVGLDAYPNPVADRLHLRLDAELAKGAAYQVLDAYGQPVLSGVLTPDLALPVAALPAGLYTLVVVGQDRQKLTQRFSKE